jgi:hypothetical protein
MVSCREKLCVRGHGNEEDMWKQEEAGETFIMKNFISHDLHKIFFVCMEEMRNAHKILV